MRPTILHIILSLFESVRLISNRIRPPNNGSARWRNHGDLLQYLFSGFNFLSINTLLTSLLIDFNQAVSTYRLKSIYALTAVQALRFAMGILIMYFNCLLCLPSNLWMVRPYSRKTSQLLGFWVCTKTDGHQTDSLKIDSLIAFVGLDNIQRIELDDSVMYKKQKTEVELDLVRLLKATRLTYCRIT